MARKFLTPIDLSKLELQNAAVQNLAGAPASPVKGQLYFNTSDSTLYWCENNVGPVWISARGGGTGFPGYGPVTSEATFGGASADGVAGTAARSDHKHANPLHDNAAHSTIPQNAFAAPTADVPWGGFKITNLGAPSAGTDATTKTYVDNIAAGLSWKSPGVRIATTANIGLTGLAAIDGVTPIANDRVLVKNQTTTNQNGIYLAASGAWTRTTDADSEAELVNAAVFVAEGTANQDTAWVQTTNAPITVGTTGLAWAQFAGGGTVGAGSGLTQSGNTLNVGQGLGITVNADDVAVSWAGNGAANTSARSDHNHDAAYPPVARSIATTAPLTGGGDLSANRTLAITSFAGSAPGAVPTSPGGATAYLRADGTWTVPPGTGWLDQTTGDTRYVNVSGDTMTSPLNLPAANPTGSTEAAHKGYVDSQITTVNGAITAKTSKFAQNVGGSTSQVVTHNLNVADYTIQVKRVASPFDYIECDMEATSTTTCTLRFAVAPAAAEYRVVVVG